MCKTDLTYVVIWNSCVQDHGGILCIFVYSTVLACRQMEPNLTTWQTLCDKKVIIFAAGINSHNAY
jgi:hypothetical protein